MVQSNGDSNDPTANLDERRLEARLISSAKVYVEIVSAIPGESDTAEIMLCTTLDLSANGLQIELDQPLMIGSILPIYIEAAEGHRYCLSGEVRWVRNGSSKANFQIGFQLYDSEQTSILEWKRFIASRL